MDLNNLIIFFRNIENFFFINFVLYDNNFDCSCLMKWMKNWLQNFNDNGQVERVENIFCKLDSFMEEKVVYILFDERFGCNGMVGQSVRLINILNFIFLVIISVVFGILLVIFIIIFIFVYVY